MRRAVVVLFLIALVTIPGAVPAGTTMLATRTMELCSNANAVDSAIKKKLIGIGWQVLSDKDGQRFRSIWVDGVAAAMGGSLTRPVHWKKALGQADQLAGIFLLKHRAKMLKKMLFLSKKNRNSALVVTMASEGGLKVFRCMYSGVTDDSMMSLIDMMSEMDKRAGRPHPTKGIDLARVQQMDGRMLTDIQVARFLPEAKSEIGRSPSVQLGFSLFRVLAR